MENFETAMTDIQAREFLRRLGLFKNTRLLQGAEREQTLTMLRLIEPEVSNNQRFWSETWKLGNRTYVLTTGEDLDELEEIIEDDF